MFTWKRLSIVLSVLVAGLVVAQVVNVPKVAAQVKAALVRNVDEPARVPYYHSARPTCPFQNECYVAGPAVQAGKRLRVTQLQGILPNQDTNIFHALHLNDTLTPLVMFPSTPFSGFFWGTMVSFSSPVDFFFEAGQVPLLEIGSSHITNDSRAKLSIVGYLVDTTP